MNQTFFEKNLKFLMFQRNIFAFLSFFLAVALILCGTLLFFKRERIIIAPPVIEKEFWVDQKSVSPTYLEQYGYFLGQLLLTKSAQSAVTQRSAILRHTDPSYAGILKQRLIEEEEILKKQSASYVFYPIDIKVHLDTMSLLLTGDRVIFMGGKQISSEQEGYLLKFSFEGARLLLKEISAQKKG